MHLPLQECESSNDQRRHGGLELIVQTQFLRLPLWNQELWMDITPPTSEHQRGTDHHGWDQTQRLWGWKSEAQKDKQREGECYWTRQRVWVYVNLKPSRNSSDIFARHPEGFVNKTDFKISCSRSFSSKFIKLSFNRILHLCWEKLTIFPGNKYRKWRGSHLICLNTI